MQFVERCQCMQPGSRWHKTLPCLCLVVVSPNLELVTCQQHCTWGVVNQPFDPRPWRLTDLRRTKVAMRPRGHDQWERCHSKGPQPTSVPNAENLHQEHPEVDWGCLDTWRHALPWRGQLESQPSPHSASMSRRTSLLPQIFFLNLPLCAFDPGRTNLLETRP